MLETPTTSTLKKKQAMRSQPAGEQSFWIPVQKQASYAEYSSYRDVAPCHPGYPNDMPYGVLPGLNLRDASLSNSDLRWKNFRGASFQRANLGGALL